ncbi:hypothetical protein [Nonomuraea cavernae]|uniref:Uncharacterized protein n=1 Tax=Nonomuraea cavernae TaxID=2045107 RepID=A0A917YQG6_9ACTN|nr:hypothetical protein [Nonomuraea cavernae]MCA2184714.1 hypothetical protein [Nonomuraea cavernae]GGO62979.1 hypothetical protein GCM10012289_08820 [Nonomuraea cavernae]
MENTLFDPPPAAERAGATRGWTTVTRKKVTVIVEDEFAAAEPIIRPGQRDFFPRNATYQWEWTPERGWLLGRYEVSGPNRKVNGEVGLMIVTERRFGTAPETWAGFPDWLYLAMVTTCPDWEPPAAQLQPTDGAVEAVMAAAADRESVSVSDDDLDRGQGW